MFRPNMNFAPEIRRDLRNVTAVAMALGLVATGCSTLSGQGPSECPPPSAASMAQAEALEALARDPYGDQADHQVHAQKSVNNVTAPDTIQWLTSQHVAAETGVTVYNPLPFELPLEQDLANGGRKPFGDYLSSMQAYLKQFDITVQLAGAPGTPPLESNMRPGVLSDLENTTAKRDAVTLMKDFASMPRQYIDVAGTKRIYIANNIGRPKKGEHSAFATGNTLVFDFDYDMTNDPLVPDHEVYHEQDGAACGGDRMGNDPTYAQLNGGQSYGPNQNVLTDEDFWSNPTIKNELGLQQKLRNEGDKAGADALNTKVDAQLAKVVFVTDYARDNSVVEDKAEVGKALPSGDWTSMLSTATPAIRAKFTELLARLYKAVPKVAKYFALMSYKTGG